LVELDAKPPERAMPPTSWSAACVPSSFLVSGPLLARASLAKIPICQGLPDRARGRRGSCSRALKSHRGLRWSLSTGIVSAAVSSARGNRLSGGTGILPGLPSVGATETLMMAARRLADGRRRWIRGNGCLEHEVVDLAGSSVANGGEECMRRHPDDHHRRRQGPCMEGRLRRDPRSHRSGPPCCWLLRMHPLGKLTVGRSAGTDHLKRCDHQARRCRLFVSRGLRSRPLHPFHPGRTCVPFWTPSATQPFPGFPTGTLGRRLFI